MAQRRSNLASRKFSMKGRQCRVNLPNYPKSLSKVTHTTFALYSCLSVPTIFLFLFTFLFFSSSILLSMFFMYFFFCLFFFFFLLLFFFFVCLRTYWEGVLCDQLRERERERERARVRDESERERQEWGKEVRAIARLGGLNEWEEVDWSTLREISTLLIWAFQPCSRSYFLFSLTITLISLSLSVTEVGRVEVWKSHKELLLESLKPFKKKNRRNA